MFYKVRELANGRFGVYQCSAYSEVLVKTFKTRKAAQGWIDRQ